MTTICTDHYETPKNHAATKMVQKFSKEPYNAIRAIRNFESNN